MVQGIPWKYTADDLKALFPDSGEVETADVMFSPEGRSKVCCCGVCVLSEGEVPPPWHAGLLGKRTALPCCTPSSVRESARAVCALQSLVVPLPSPTQTRMCWQVRQTALQPSKHPAPIPATANALDSQGWGTVRFVTTDAASKAIEDFHGSQLEGRTLTVFLDKKA